MATNSLLRSCLVLVPLLGACIDPGPGPGPGPGPRPDPEPVSNQATVSGVVEIDNGIANATVFADFNSDNLLSWGEPSTKTDATGHFTLTWTNDSYFTQATMIGAVVDESAVGYELHMSAPLVAMAGKFTTTGVTISPLTTLVQNEMLADPTFTLTQADAETKIANALKASQMPFTAAPHVMSDYAADYATNADSAQLRYVASAVAAIIATTAAKCNEVQSLDDCNDSMITTPAIVAMDKQLTVIATATHAFLQLPSAQQAAMQTNPANYRNMFINTNTLENDLEAALIALALDFLADLFEYVRDEFTTSVQDALTEMVVDQLIDLVL